MKIQHSFTLVFKTINGKKHCTMHCRNILTMIEWYKY